MTTHTPPITRIIAEIGSVHDGSFGNAVKLIEAAAACGADTVKFQIHIAEAETLTDAPMPSYFTGEPRMAYFPAHRIFARSVAAIAGGVRALRRYVSLLAVQPGGRGPAGRGRRC
jgi:hypothetical protein